MVDTLFSELQEAIHVMMSSTWIMITLGTSSVASVITESNWITNDTIFELASEIDEDISTEYALDVDGDGGDSDVEVD